MWDIWQSKGHFGEKNNNCRHIEGSFQTNVLITGHFKGAFWMNNLSPTDGHFELPWFLSLLARDDAEGHIKKLLFGHLHHLKLSLQEVNPSRGLGMSPSKWNAGLEINKCLFEEPRVENLFSSLMGCCSFRLNVCDSRGHLNFLCV